MFNKPSFSELFPGSRAQKRRSRKKKAIGIGLTSAVVATIAGVVTKKEQNRP